jgi:hypothetical protein
MPLAAAESGGFRPHSRAFREKCRSVILIEIKPCAAVNAATETVTVALIG